MEQKSKGWIISQSCHPNTGAKYLVESTYASTRKEAIKSFMEGSSKDWRYWYRKYNFRCVKCELTINTKATNN